MEDGLEARKLFHPIFNGHPMAGAVNRITEKLDKEYRLALQGLWATDSLSAYCQRYEI